MFKKLRLIFLIVFTCLFGLTPVYANTIINPGFEQDAATTFNGGTYGWNYDLDWASFVSVQLSGYEGVTAKEPTHFLRLEASYSYVEDVGYPPTFAPTYVMQEFSLAATSSVFFEGYVTGNLLNGDLPYVQICLGETPQISNYVTITTMGEWVHWTLTTSLNQGDYTIRYGITNSGDLGSTAYFDAYNAVPEPATLILLMAGVLGIGMVRRKLN